MTVEEKIGQLLQLSADFFDDGKAVITGPMTQHKISLETVYNAGSVLGISGAKKVRRIQKDYLEHNRLKIPLLFMADIVHGYQTIFPIPLALGATFDSSTVKEVSKISALEASAGGIHVTFAPMVDLVRDPRWGRVMESAGEDPYLNSVMAEASVKGFQGDHLSLENVASCVKHFAAYGAPEAGREYNTVDISEWRFREQYLPAYTKAIESQALLVMTSFNVLFGVPATANRHLMRDILRQELKFKGVLISDWDAIGELVVHGVAGDLRHAADLALEAGVDIDMVSFAYAQYLIHSAKLNRKTEQLINEATLRILELKDKLGLFEDPYRGISEEREFAVLKLPENMTKAQHAAEKSMVLLKNQDNILPLNKHTKLAVIGPAANTGEILGSWSWQGNPDETEPYLSALLRHFEYVNYAKGSGYHNLDPEELKKAVEVSYRADVIVAFLGLPQSESGEATSISDLHLPIEQRKLVSKLAALNKPLIIVINTGRPLILTDLEKMATAILISWFPGSRGAEAVSNILDGTVSPSGKLPMTFPRSMGQIPIYYNSYITGRPISESSANDSNHYLSKYIDESNDPLYPFGFGLTYANLNLKSVSLDKNQIYRDDNLKIISKVENSSNRDGVAVVQCYVHQEIGDTVRPIKQLIEFHRVNVPANKTVTVTFNISTRKFVSIHADLRKKIDSGKYKIMVGLDSQDLTTRYLFVKN